LCHTKMEFVSWSLCQLFVQCEYTYLATNECKQCPTVYFTHLHTWHFQVRSDLSNYHLKLLELCFTWQTPQPFQSHKQVGRNPFFAVVSHANDIYTCTWQTHKTKNGTRVPVFAHYREALIVCAAAEACLSRERARIYQETLHFSHKALTLLCA